MSVFFFLHIEKVYIDVQINRENKKLLFDTNTQIQAMGRDPKVGHGGFDLGNPPPKKINK